ncbi:PQQ-dependent sugar dehydrogenase [Algoriphagus pacificus]|uniref:PQQ-dependent sugar dehydrogenase n=1 Tax=Algoriphagus pacificus TaxID=2811234 RepID=A0ABS3CFG4_9BACT|nr:PQQ-dependent sugar dehydrogenase [Algoriphagus pacificus]MBN7814389.1 PQQ-dependent sugar dehydrogenase [Algoriphagus pacificus]
MKNRINLVAVLFLLFAFSCSEPETKEFGVTISQDVDQIKAGKVLFDQNCSTCHNFNENAIGPNLSGVTRQVDTDWIKRFIKNPSEFFEAKDERAERLLAVYKTQMPAFPNFSESDLNSILSYLHTFETLPLEILGDTTSNLIPEKIQDSGIKFELEFFAQLPASDTTPALAKMTKMEPIPGTNRLMINDQRIGIYELVDQKPQLYLNLLEQRPDMVSKPGWATGLGSFTFHPEFLENGLFYTAHTEPGGTKPSDFGYTDSLKVFMQWVLTEWKAESPSSKTFEGTSREILRIDNASQAHGMQELTFNPNSKKGDDDFGLLYIGYGDGGTVEKRFAYISDHGGSGIYSSILRIDPAGNNSANGKYGIPTINPFSGDQGKAGEVLAYGFRNPNRIFWDESGKLFATDIGQHSIEEINLIEPGKFYGWPIREGRFMINPFGSFRTLYPLPADDDKKGVTYPLIQLEHDEAVAVIGGYFIPDGKLKGNIVFGDIPTGRLFFADLDQNPNPEVKSMNVVFEGKETTMEEIVGGRVDLKFGIDAEKQVYIMSKNQGIIYKIVNTL